MMSPKVKLSIFVQSDTLDPACDDVQQLILRFKEDLKKTKTKPKLQVWYTNLEEVKLKHLDR